MSSAGSVSLWLLQLKNGDSAAAQGLWQRYAEKLVRLARKKLQGAPRRAADEEDVVLIHEPGETVPPRAEFTPFPGHSARSGTRPAGSCISAFDSFCRGAERGRFARLDDRDDLWQLLVLITERKGVDLVVHERRLKRGGGAVVGEQGCALEQVVGSEPTPEFASQVAEEFERLLAKLNSAELCRVALLKMEGYSNAEIAEQLGCVPRTVERKLRVIRSLWNGEAAS